MKGDAVYKRAFNALLDLLTAAEVGASIDTETRLAARLAVSRTTIRKALSELKQRGVIRREPSGTTRMARRPGKPDYFPTADTLAASTHVENCFMEWVLRGDRRPGEQINGLELARAFGVSTNAVREHLAHFSRFGLIERRPNSGWILLGFTPAFALELFEIREMFEIRSARAFAEEPPTSSVWTALRGFEAEHYDLLAAIATRHQDFSELDGRFHRFIYQASRNRFIADFHALISLIFHYHYQWDKADERVRNTRAIEEHLAYIEALVTRDPSRIERACRRHLETAKATLLAAIR